MYLTRAERVAFTLLTTSGCWTLAALALFKYTERVELIYYTVGAYTAFVALVILDAWRRTDDDVYSAMSLNDRRKSISGV